MSDPNDLLATTTEADAAPTTGTTTYLDQLIGPDKQFKDADAVAKAKIDSDRFIKQLQRENAELLNKSKELEQKADVKLAMADVLNELKNRAPNENSNQPAISEDDIARMVRKQFDTAATEKTEAANVAAANALLLKKFAGDGEAAKKYLAGKLVTLGLNSQTVRNLAKSSPDAFAELLGLSKQADTQRANFVPSTVNAGNANSNGADSGLRNAKYYNGLLKEMGVAKFYANKTLLNQKEQDMESLGDRYLDT